MTNHAMIPATGTAYLVDVDDARIVNVMQVIAYTTTATRGRTTVSTVAINSQGSPEVLTVNEKTGMVRGEHPRHCWLFVTPEGTPVDEEGAPPCVAETLADLREINAKEARVKANLEAVRR